MMRRSIVSCISIVVLWTAMAAAAHAAPVTGVFSVDGVRLRSFPTIAAGSSVAAGDLDGNGTDEIVVGSRPGVRAQVTIYEFDGTVIRRIYPYGSGMKAGINVALGDLDGSGTLQIIVAPRRGGGPQVVLYSATGRRLNLGIWAYARTFSGGVNLAAGDVDGDGRDEIITGAGPGGGPHVSSFRNNGLRLWNAFPYDLSLRSGLAVTVLDVDGNGTDEVITVPQRRHTTDIVVTDFPSSSARSSFRAFGRFSGGATVAGLRTAASSRLVVGAGPGGGPDVKQYDASTGQEVARHFFAFDRSWRGGVSVTAVDINGDGQQEIMAVAGVPTLSAAELAAYDSKYIEPEVNGVSYSSRRVQSSSGFFTVRSLSVDLDAPNIVVKTVASTDGDCGGTCPTHPLQYYVDLAGGFAGINGSYFCPASDASCASRVGTYFWLWYNSVSGSFVNLAQNSYNTDPVLVFSAHNATTWYPVSKDFHTKEEFEATTGTTLTALLSNTPMLVDNGKSVVRKSTLDTSQRLIKATRVGIGLKGRTLVIFVVSRATVLDLAHVGVALQLDTALNLDGGSSTAFVYQNSYKVGPGRNVPNAIVLASQ